MINFDPVKHEYTNALTNEKYTSVSKVLEKFKSEFDKQTISRFVAEKRGVSQQEILDEWAKTNKDSQIYGTATHAALENYAKTGIIEEQHKTLISEFQKMGDYTKKSGALQEQILHSHQYKVAGTADIIYPTGKYFDVFDIKTNKAFNFYSKYGKQLKYPVEHLNDCEYNNYSLQLSLYAYLYQIMTGRIARHLAVFYWDKEKETFTKYPVAYLKHDVINILNQHARTTAQ